MYYGQPPPYDYQHLPPYDDMEKIQQKQTEIETLLQNMLDTKDATLSKATQDTIRNIMFLFEHRFDSLEKELLAKIKQTASWIQTIPVVEQEHTEMKHHVDQLLAHMQLLDAQLRQMEDHMKHHSLVERITVLEQKLDAVLEQKEAVEADRWTDQKNAMCRINNLNISSLSIVVRNQGEFPVTDFLLKPLPHYVNINGSYRGGLSSFLERNRVEYLCSCYNCILLQKYKRASDEGGVFKTNMCPLDSDCTCMTFCHRMSFVHSIETGYIKDRDKELSPIQRFYAKGFYFNNNNKLVCIPTLNGLSVYPDGTVHSNDLLNNKIFLIVNCTRRDGVDVYQYQTSIIRTGKYQLHETFADKLYVWTNKYEYPPRDPSTFDKSHDYLQQNFQQNICVPIEKYLADTMDADRFFSGKVSRTVRKKSKQKMRYSNKKHVRKSK